MVIILAWALVLFVPFFILMELNDRLEVLRWARKLRKLGWSEEDIEFVSKAGYSRDLKEMKRKEMSENAVFITSHSSHFSKDF
jgi:hypothetical protein